MPKMDLSDFDDMPAKPDPTPDLSNALNAMYDTESGDKQLDSEGNPITSSAGAIGAAQIMPSTGPEAADLAGEEWDEDRFNTDKDYNKKLGAAYFKNQLGKFGGDYQKAFAAYNAGPTRMKKIIADAEAQGIDWKDHPELPSETKDYVAKNSAKMGLDRKPASKKKLDLSDFDDESKDSNSIFGEHQDIGDTLKGVGQGITLGGGDELLAAGQTGKDVLTGDAKLQDLYDRWRKHQKENEADYKKAKERSPWLTGAGEVAGGIPTAMATMGGTAELGLAQKMLQMGKLGAGIGALSSESDIEHPADLAKDTVTGGLMGAGTELGLSAGSKLAKTAGKPVMEAIENKINDFPTLRQHVKAFKEGVAGKGFLGDTNRTRLIDEAEGQAKDLTSQFDKMRGVASDEYGKVMTDAPAISKYTTSQLKDFDTAHGILDTANKRLGISGEEGLATLTKIKNGEQVTAQEAKNLQMYLRDKAGKINQGETMDQLLGAKKSADQLLKDQVPGYSKVNDMFQKVQEPIESFLTNTPPGELSVGSQPSARTLGTKEYQTAKKAIESSQRPFMGGQESFEKLNQLKKGLQNLEQTNPDALKKMGITNVEDFMNNIRDKSDVQSIAKTISGTGSLSNTNDILRSGLSLTYGGANVAGKAVGAASNIGRGLYNMPAKGLVQVSSALKQDPSLAHLGEALEKSLQDPTSNAKNAILFSIIQNPKSRQAVEGMMNIPGVENSNEK